MTRYSIGLRIVKNVREHGFLSFTRDPSKKHGGKIFGYHYKNGLDAAKTASKKVVHKTTETTLEWIGNEIAEKIVKLKLVPDASSRIAEKVFIPSEKRQEILNEIKYWTKYWTEMNWIMMLIKLMLIIIK